MVRRVNVQHRAHNSFHHSEVVEVTFKSTTSKSSTFCLLQTGILKQGTLGPPECAI